MPPRKDKLPKDAVKEYESLEEKRELLRVGPAFYDNLSLVFLTMLQADDPEAAVQGYTDTSEGDEWWRRQITEYFWRMVAAKDDDAIRNIADALERAVNRLKDPQTYRPKAVLAADYEAEVKRSGEKGSAQGLVDYLKAHGQTIDVANARKLRRELR